MLQLSHLIKLMFHDTIHYNKKQSFDLLPDYTYYASLMTYQHRNC